MSASPQEPPEVSATPRREPVAPLFHAAAAGDQTAWNALVARYINLVWSVARSFRLSEADAGDVVQTTWLRLLEHMDSIQDPERLPGWLTTTARRECLRVLRRSNVELVAINEDATFDIADELAPALDAALLDDERDVVLWQCFGQLSDRCRRLLRVLMAAEPQAYAEVSLAFGMPIGSIGPTRMRCLDRLRAITEAQGYDFTERNDDDD